MTAEAIQHRVSTVPQWRHRIRLPGGVVTPGSQDTLTQLEAIGLPPDLSGLTVLDIGCSDGFYSFECERRGAARVLAVDNWSSVYIDGPSGFQVAHEVLESRVEYMNADLFDLDPARVGQFDLVLFLGVLYHLRHPLLAMERLAALCRRHVIVETGIVIPPTTSTRALLKLLGIAPPDTWMQFFPHAEANRDPTNWWTPTPACAEAMLASCGFCGVRTVTLTGSRGVFHGFAPDEGSDAEQLVPMYGREAVEAVLMDVLGEQARTSPLETTLCSLSVAQFGRVRQELAERRARHWHKHERWQPGAR